MEPLERALTAAEPYRTVPGAIAALAFGSSLRPYRDPLSDLDIWVFFEDQAYAALDERQRYVVTITPGPPRRKDVEIVCVPLAMLEQSQETRRDPVHAAYYAANVLFDTDDRLRDALVRLTTLSEEDRQHRMRVHYRELVWAMEKAPKARKRGNLAAARLIEGCALDAARRLAFVVRGLWPSQREWVTQEMALAKVPAPVVTAFTEASLADPPALDAIRRAFDAWLTEEGHTFHHNTLLLGTWVLSTPEGRLAVERWSTLI